MTRLLEKAFEEAAKLSDDAQDSLAKFLMEELASERQWDKLFAESADLLSELADEALADRAAGHTTELDPDKL